MKLSIITINYNNLNGLLRTRESIICQTFKDYEWIVIDGGSTDGAKEFLQEHNDEFAYWCSEKDKGVYNAQNKGITKAKGEYLIFMNSGDSFFSRDTLEKVFSQERTADILYGNWIQVYNDGRMEQKNAPEDVSLHFFFNNNICHQAMFIKNSVMALSPYDEGFRIYADWAKWIELLLAKCTFEYVNVTICRFTMDGISQTDLNTCREEFKKIQENSYSKAIRNTIKNLLHDEEVIKNLKHSNSEFQEEIARQRNCLTKVEEKNRDKDKEIEALQQELATKQNIIDAQNSQLNHRSVRFALKIEKFLLRFKEGKWHHKKQKSPFRTLHHIFDKVYNIFLIKKSGLFDSKWYKEQYPDVTAYRKSPLSHFLKIGYKMYYDPSPDFCTKRYARAYPDVGDRNPLCHYLRKGKRQGRIKYTTKDMGVLKPVPTTLTPLISIVVTSYNYEKYIGETLDSLVNQTYRNIEVIVVDDGSADNSVDVIKDYVKRYPYIHLFQHPNGKNRGIIASMRLGINKAKGEFVAFCESDDYWHPENLDRKVEIINKYEDAVIIANDVKFFGDAESIKRFAPYNETRKAVVRDGGTPIDIRHYYQFNFIPTLSCIMIKRDILMTLNYDSPIPAWIDLWLYRQILQSHILYNCDKELTFWRQHPKSYNSIVSNEGNNSCHADEFFFLGNIMLKVTKGKKTRDIKLIERSPLFDEEYYSTQIAKEGYNMSPAMHYYYIGWKKGLNPSRQFSTNGYLLSYPDIQQVSMCPLLHYEVAGRAEGREILSVEDVQRLAITEQDIEDVEELHRHNKLVLLVSHELSLTGAPFALMNMAEAIYRQGVTPVILAHRSGPLKQRLEEKGFLCKIVLLNSMIGMYNDEVQKGLITKYISNFDAVLFNTLETVPLVNCLSDMTIKKYCWIHEGIDGYRANNFKSQLRENLSLYDTVYVVGKYAEEIIQKQTHFDGNLQQLLYYIEDVKGDSIMPPEEIETSGKFRMVIAGVVSYRKGHDVLLECLDYISQEYLNDMEILIAGVTDKSDIANKIEGGKFKNIKLLGGVSHEKLMRLMQTMDILLCPSMDDPMPIVCTEAFMLAKPVIVGTNTGTAAFIKDGINGFVVESGNKRLLAEAITKAYHMRKELPDMGSEARKIFKENFTEEIFAKKIKALLANI